MQSVISLSVGRCEWQHGDGSFDDVIQRIALVAGIDNGGFGRIAAAMAVFEEFIHVADVRC